MSELAGIETPAAGETTPPDEGGLTMVAGQTPAFEDLMDTLGAFEESEAAGQDGAAAGADTPAEGQPAAGAEGAGATATDAVAPAGGDGGQPAAPQPGAAAAQPDAGAAAGGALPADWTRSVSELKPQLDALTTDFETAITNQYQEEAYEAVKQQHAKFFEAIAKSPRLLVGTQVPSLKPDAKDGDMETLRDEADVTSWQEAVKSILVDEIRDKATASLTANSEAINAYHASIELFQNNPDLVPRTKEFDKELADRFAKISKPYQLRVDGKLQGFSIPTQPLIDSIREELKASRAAAPAAPVVEEPVDPPQPGITSKSGQSAETNTDIGDLFATLGEEWRHTRI